MLRLCLLLFEYRRFHLFQDFQIGGGSDSDLRDVGGSGGRGDGVVEGARAAAASSSSSTSSTAERGALGGDAAHQQRPDAAVPILRVGRSGRRALRRHLEFA